jgi:hypothetical protein
MMAARTASHPTPVLFTTYKGFFMSTDAPGIEPALKPHEPTLLRDPHIREPLHHWLRVVHADCADTEILHELKMPRPSARIDVAVINGELCGFEIKSDVDSLVRLPRQRRAFSAVFDRVSVVTTLRHLESVNMAVPDWWGLIVARQCGGTALFSIEREANRNPNPSTEALLHMLSRNEIIKVLEADGLAHGLRSKRRATLIDAVLDNVSAVEIGLQVKELFKVRAVRHRHHPRNS